MFSELSYLIMIYLVVAVIKCLLIYENACAAHNNCATLHAYKKSDLADVWDYIVLPNISAFSSQSRLCTVATTKNKEISK